MTQEVVRAPEKTLAMQLAEVKLGRPLEDYLRELYVDQGMSLRDVASVMGLNAGTVSRWMALLGIQRRPVGSRRPD